MSQTIAELKAEFTAQLRTELETEVSELKAEFKAELRKADQRLSALEAQCAAAMQELSNTTKKTSDDSRRRAQAGWPWMAGHGWLAVPGVASHARPAWLTCAAR